MVEGRVWEGLMSGPGACRQLAFLWCFDSGPNDLGVVVGVWGWGLDARVWVTRVCLSSCDVIGEDVVVVGRHGVRFRGASV